MALVKCKKIKKHIKLAIASILIMSAASQYAMASEWHDNCKMNAEIAASIMKGRQKGVPMAEMMEVVTKNSNNKSAAEIMVIAAYENPRYGSDKMRQRSVEDFHNDVYLVCAQEGRKNE